MHDTLDTNRILANAKEDDVIAHDGEPRFFADLRTEPIDFRSFCDFLDLCMKKTEHARGVVWAVLCDVLSDLFKVAWNEGG
jgi:hypothetical protein